MKFTLNYTPPPSQEKIDHNKRLFLIGSCFAENIGDLLREHGFNTLINPSGIVFNPLSICETISNALLEKQLPDHYFLEREAKYFSYAHHSSVAANSDAELRKITRYLNRVTNEFVRACDVIFISLGSAFVYKLVETGDIVANCHKQPSGVFEKVLLETDEIVARFEETFQLIKNVNPQIKIVLSVSPVKYIRDGLVNNNRSKATLLLAAHRLTEKMEAVQYFPSYELVVDDLRDYRFYKEDLAHPNNQAILYVWEKFGDVFFSEKTREVVKEIHKLNLSLKHRPMHGDAQSKALLEASIEKQKARILQIDPSLKLPSGL